MIAGAVVAAIIIALVTAFFLGFFDSATEGSDKIRDNKASVPPPRTGLPPKSELRDSTGPARSKHERQPTEPAQPTARWKWVLSGLAGLTGLAVVTTWALGIWEMPSFNFLGNNSQFADNGSTSDSPEVELVTVNRISG